MAHRVLVVDDSQAIRTFVDASLEVLDDINVDLATTGFEALKLLPRGRYDLLITDINMPDISGLELVQYARAHAQCSNVPILVISTEGTERDVSKAMTLGATQFLVKPLTSAQLVQAVVQLLGRSQFPPP